ncbi:hypothetical protein L596_015862 [Steinernema carpocapsae]|uniref:PABS domain-containing protein n=1 Tax=Steinernema carpocapsae TaxID=34508 RepID=A0A4U5NGD9_STECR|nr:hypothetical protein L596_015862 [Steinernema carpocapsae]
MSSDDSFEYVEMTLPKKPKKRKLLHRPDWLRVLQTIVLSRIFALFAAILFVVWILYFLSIAMITESKTLIVAKTVNFVEIDRICTPPEDEIRDCYVVSDYVDWKTNKAWRMTRSEKATNESELESHFSRVALIVQNDTLPSREWSIDHSTILGQYLAVMAALPFTLDSFQAAKPRILSIGLGGGVLDMFLHFKKPMFEITVAEIDKTIVEIAHKWCGVEETAQRTTLNENGIDVLSRTVKTGGFFDAVFIDACNLTSYDTTCPVEAFADRKNVADVSDSLQKQGSVVVNVVARRSNGTEKYYEKVLNAYLYFFPVCLKATMPSGNIVLACAKSFRNADDENNLRDKITNRWNVAANDLGLREMLKSVNITVIVKSQNL